MRFKDLPSYEEIVNAYKKFYTFDINSGEHKELFNPYNDTENTWYTHVLLMPVSYQEGPGFLNKIRAPFRKKKNYKFDKLSEAYEFLKKNPNVEVRDDFFGNGLPFIWGYEILHRIVICDLRVVEESSYNVVDISHDYSHYIDFHEIVDINKYISFLNSAIVKNQYIVIDQRHFLYQVTGNLNMRLHFMTPNHAELAERLKTAKITEEIKEVMVL